MPDERLHVAQNETYTIPSGITEEWSGATIEGELNVDGQLELVDDPDLPASRSFDESPFTISLPLSPLNLSTMNLGTAWFITGTLGLLLVPIGLFRNYAAGIVWSMALVALLFSGLLGIGLEAFWALVIGTVLAVGVGMVVSWSN